MKGAAFDSARRANPIVDGGRAQPRPRLSRLKEFLAAKRQAKARWRNRPYGMCFQRDLTNKIRSKPGAPLRSAPVYYGLVLRTERLAARPAFTLLELLTIIAVIAVLCSVLLPTLGRARNSAQQASCFSNLHQLALAGQMYWDDNSGSTFRWRGASTNNGQIFWFGWLENGAEGQRRFDPAYGALYPYLGARGVETCPAFNYVSPSVKLKASGTSYGYGYNLALSAPPDSPPINVGKTAHPAGLIFLGDAAQVNTFQAPASPDHPMLEEFYYIDSTEATTHFRHNGRADAAFCDGHAGPERPAPGSLDTRLPREIIGRFSTELLTP